MELIVNGDTIVGKGRYNLSLLPSGTVTIVKNIGVVDLSMNIHPTQTFLPIFAHLFFAHRKFITAA